MKMHKHTDTVPAFNHSLPILDDEFDTDMDETIGIRFLDQDMEMPRSLLAETSDFEEMN